MIPDVPPGYCPDCGFREHAGECTRTPPPCPRCAHRPTYERTAKLAAEIRACECECHAMRRLVERVAAQ